MRKHFQKGNALVGAISEHLEKKEVKYIDANIVHHHIYVYDVALHSVITSNILLQY